MEIYKFYSANNPKLNEIVSCIIVDINEKENIVKLYLKDYNLNAIMSFKNAKISIFCPFTQNPYHETYFLFYY